MLHNVGQFMFLMDPCLNTNSILRLVPDMSRAACLKMSTRRALLNIGTSRSPIWLNLNLTNLEGSANETSRLGSVLTLVGLKSYNLTFSVRSFQSENRNIILLLDVHLYVSCLPELGVIRDYNYTSYDDLEGVTATLEQASNNSMNSSFGLENLFYLECEHN